MKRSSVRALTTLGALLFSALVVAAATERIAPRSGAADCSHGIVSRLYLGQQTPAGDVTETDWRSFVQTSVTPRFPAGFTELRGEGHWRGEGDASIEERTRIVEIAHDGTPRVRDHIRAIASDYRDRFGQESVLVTQAQTLYCFENEATLTQRAVR